MLKHYLWKNPSNKDIVNEMDREAMKEKAQQLLEGSQIPLDEFDIKNIKSVPEWVDKDMIQNGQRFANKYYFSATFADLISLYLLLAINGIIKALIFTNKSSSSRAAFKRYLSTTQRVANWFFNDLTDESSDARKQIDQVNQMHCSVLSQMISKEDSELSKLTTLKNRFKGELRNTTCPFLIKDVKKLSANLIDEKIDELNKRTSESNTHCDRTIYKEKYDQKGKEIIVEETKESKEGNQINKVIQNDSLGLNKIDEYSSKFYINQYTMAVTQFGFMGMIVLYPQKLGIFASKNEILSFIHLWNYLGYLLGIDDKFNLCKGTYEQVVINCKSILELIIKPKLSALSSEWEQMSYAACGGVNLIFGNVVFESTLLLLMNMIGVNCNELYKSMSWKQKLYYYYYKLILCLLRIRWLRKYFNNYAKRKLKNALSKNK